MSGLQTAALVKVLERIATALEAMLPPIEAPPDKRCQNECLGQYCTLRMGHAGEHTNVDTGCHWNDRAGSAKTPLHLDI